MDRLEESELRLRVAVSRLPIIMWTADADLRFTWGNGAALGSLELDVSAFSGRRVADFFPGEEGESSPLAKHRLALSGRSVRFEFEWLEHWFDVHLEPMRSPDGAVVGVIGIAVDLTERKKAEDALRRSEDRFILLGRATSDMAWDWDLETDSIWRNENLQTVFGYSAEDMEPAGSWWEHYIHPEDRERVTKSIRDAIAGGERFWSSEYRWQRKDGVYATVLDRGYVIHDEHGKPVRMVGSTMDVTKRRREQQIREAVYRISEAGATAEDLPAFYEAVHTIVGQLMPAQNFYIALHDPETDLLSFPYFVDEEESAPAPYKAGRGLTEYVLRSGKPFYASTEGYERLVATGEVVRLGPMSIDWVGVPLIAQGKTIGALVVQTYTEGVRYGEEERDVLGYVSEQIAMAIERKRAAEALRREETRYRIITENAQDVIYLYRLVPAPGFEFVSPSVTEITGYTPEEHYADPDLGRKIVHPDDQGMLRSLLKDPANSMAPLVLRWVRKDGSVLWTEQRNVPIYDDRGRVVAIQGIARDITSQKEAERAVLGSEARYRLLFEANPTPMWVYDRETLAFLAVNDIAIDHYGYSRDEFLSMTIKDIRPPEYVDALVESVRSPRQEISYSGVWKHRTKDGRLMDVEITSHTLTFAGRSAALVIATDITARKEAQDALKAAEAKFRSLVEQSLVGIYIIQGDGFVYVNPKCGEIFGYTPEEVVSSRRVVDLVAPEDRETVRERIRRRLSGEVRTLQYTFRGLRKDGSRIRVEVHGTMMEFNGAPAIIGSLLDVTQREVSEENLRRSETRFRTLFEAAADAILLVNEKGIILDANPAAGAIVDQDRRELTGVILERYLLEEDLKRARAYLRLCFRRSTPPEPFEITIVTSKGHRRSLAVRSRLVSEEDSEPYVEMLIRDVTEQREMQRRLVASERLASVGQMAAYIAHEINTPLANISLLAAASKRRTKDPEVRERLEKIDAQRRQAATIIAELLSFTKHREIQPSDVDLRTVLAASIEQIEPYRRNEVELLANLGDQPVPAHVDPLQMQEVFVNVLRNAFEATSRGSVTLRLELRPGYRLITIADTGRGIPTEVQSRLFQPFVTTKRLKGGTGLGLALCKSIVTAHGGEIHFTTTQGKGTTFTITLPQVEG